MGESGHEGDVAGLEDLVGIVSGAVDATPTLRFAVEADEGVFGAAGEVGSAELGEEKGGVEGNAVVGLSGEEKTRDTISDSGVCVGRIGGVGVDVHRCASCIGGLTTTGARESVGTDATTSGPGNYARASISTRRTGLASGCHGGPGLRVLPRNEDESNGNENGGSDQKEKDYHEGDEGPERHSTTSSTRLLRVDFRL